MLRRPTCVFIVLHYINKYFIRLWYICLYCKMIVWMILFRSTYFRLKHSRDLIELVELRKIDVGYVKVTFG